MRTFWIIGCIGSLLLGIGIGYLLPKERTRANVHLRSGRMSDEDIARIKAYIATSTNSYPIPSSVDFSTNTLRQLVFWRSFCLTYDFWRGHPYREAIRTPGINFDDPRWFEFVDAQRGWEFAEWLYHCKDVQHVIKEGDIPKWVETNYAGFYDENYYRRFNLSLPVWYDTGLTNRSSERGASAPRR